MYSARLVTDDHGLFVLNNVQLRRFSCACDECRKGGECLGDIGENAWHSYILEPRQAALVMDDEDLD